MDLVLVALYGDGPGLLRPREPTEQTVRCYRSHVQAGDRETELRGDADASARLLGDCRPALRDTGVCE